MRFYDARRARERRSRYYESAALVSPVSNPSLSIVYTIILLLHLLVLLLLHLFPPPLLISYSALSFSLSLWSLLFSMVLVLSFFFPRVQEIRRFVHLISTALRTRLFLWEPGVRPRGRL